MKYLTMVARCGNPKAGASAMKFTLIADDFSVHTMPGNTLTRYLTENKVVVTNMAMSPKGLVSTNGAMNRYTLFDDGGKIVNTPSAVILNRVEVDGKLAGYIYFTPNGTVAKGSIANLVKLAKEGLVANGKVRSTESGDIVSSIGGNYPLLELKENKPATTEVTVDILLFGSSYKGNAKAEYAGVSILCKDSRAISEIHAKMDKQCKELQTRLKEQFNWTDEELSGFDTRPSFGAGFYGVYPLEIVEKLLEKSKAKCSIKNVMISSKDCSVKDPVEEIGVYSIKSKSGSQFQSGNGKSKEYLEKYMQKVIGILDSKVK